MSNFPLCNSGECSGGRGGNADCMNKNSKIWPEPFMPNHPAWDRPSNLQIGQLNLADYKRAMLCVNACLKSNIPDEYLEKVISGNLILITDAV